MDCGYAATSIQAAKSMRNNSSIPLWAIN